MTQILLPARDEATGRVTPRLSTARKWHRDMMKGLDVPQPAYVGQYRGEAGLEGIDVRVDGYFGVRSDYVADALIQFEQTIAKRSGDARPANKTQSRFNRGPIGGGHRFVRMGSF